MLASMFSSYVSSPAAQYEQTSDALHRDRSPALWTGSNSSAAQSMPAGETFLVVHTLLIPGTRLISSLLAS